MDKNTSGSSGWLAGFLARISMLINVAILLLVIFMVFHGIFFSHRKRREASSQAEASYWRLRWWGFAVGAYAIIVFFWAVIDANSSHDAPHLIDYWPAVCMLWTNDSWFGADGHSTTVACESIFMGFVACVVGASARLYGSYNSEVDQFTPTN